MMDRIKEQNLRAIAQYVLQHLEVTLGVHHAEIHTRVSFKDLLSAVFGQGVLPDNERGHELEYVGSLLASLPVFLSQCVLEGEPLCAYCGASAKGSAYGIHRDGFGEGPEVPLCDTCGGDNLLTCKKIWARIAQPQAVEDIS